MRKKIALLIILLAVTAIFFACGQKSDGSSETETQTDTPDTEYVGTNGNYWLKTEDTGKKAEDVSLTDGNLAVYEHSISLAENRYFEKTEIAFGTETVALTGGYVRGITDNRYSGVTVRKITVYASKAGTLTFGACPITDFGSGEVHFTAAEQFELSEGYNTCECRIDIASGETLALGAEGDTASLTVYSGEIPDEGNGDAVLLREDKEVRLPITVSVGAFEGELYGGEQQSYTGGTTFIYSLAPFIYQDTTVSGRTVTGIKVKTNACKEGASFTVSVVLFQNMQLSKTAQTVVLTAKEDFEAGWHYLELETPIEVPENYTLGFGADGDTMPVQFFTTSGFSFYNNTKQSAVYDTTNSLGIVICGIEPVQTMAERDEKVKKEIHLLPLDSAQLSALAEKLQGKKISIMGDSISTYQNISNSQKYNSTITGNAVFYFNQIPVAETWWRRTIDTLGAELCVNNSYSGSEVWTGAGLSYKERAVNLHNDNTGEEPDIIFVFMGTNDERNDPQNQFVAFDEEKIKACVTVKEDGSVEYKNPASFLEAYAIMLDKMMRRYPDAQVFLMTMAPSYLPSDPSGTHLTRYAELICEIGDYFGLPTVNLVTDSGLTLDNIASYSLGDALHPNSVGMKMISDTLLKRMYEFYCEK